MRAASLLLVLVAALPASVQARQEGPPTRADTLRGSIGPTRSWWDVVHYDLALRVNPTEQTIAGSNTIHYAVVGPSGTMQIDLSSLLQVDSVVQQGRRLEHRRDGDVMLVQGAAGTVGGTGSVTVYFGGRPRVAANAPWDGGFVWARGPSGTPWVGTAVQGIGASQFWPNKDHQSDEPDSMRIRLTVPSGLVAVSNGRLAGTEAHADGTTTYTWRVASPINNYNVTVNAARYAHFSDRFDGEAGPLDLDYWVLEPNLETARRHFEQVKPMLRCFESWFGPYPFYEDGFKMVETPYLGMEHQSAIAYGNRYLDGYLGQDLSGTGLGLTWDYIIVHEAGHEWFGNNITTKDIADLWIHEGFTTYTEGVFVECQGGKEAGARYIRGLRSMIENAAPITGPYGVNREGASDMYSKGANVLHTLRQVVDDDALWRSVLRGLGERFRHQTVTAAQVEGYIAERLGRDLAPFFEQYARRGPLPVLEYSHRGGTLRYRWSADVAGFDMPVRVTLGGGRTAWIHPVTGSWKEEAVTLASPDAFGVDPDFLVGVREVQPGG